MDLEHFKTVLSYSRDPISVLEQAHKELLEQYTALMEECVNVCRALEEAYKKIRALEDLVITNMPNLIGKVNK